MQPSLSIGGNVSAPIFDSSDHEDVDASSGGLTKLQLVGPACEERTADRRLLHRPRTQSTPSVAPPVEPIVPAHLDHSLWRKPLLLKLSSTLALTSLCDLRRNRSACLAIVT